MSDYKSGFYVVTAHGSAEADPSEGHTYGPYELGDAISVANKISDGYEDDGWDSRVWVVLWGFRPSHPHACSPSTCGKEVGSANFGRPFERATCKVSK